MGKEVQGIRNVSEVTWPISDCGGEQEVRYPAPSLLLCAPFVDVHPVIPMTTHLHMLITLWQRSGLKPSGWRMLRTAGKGSPLHPRSLEHRCPRATEAPRFRPNILVMGTEAVAALSLTRGETREGNTWVWWRDIKPAARQSPEQLRAAVSFPWHTVT